MSILKSTISSKVNGRKVLLINPSMDVLYVNAKVKPSVPIYPPISLALLAGALRSKGYEVKIFDMIPEGNTYEILKEVLACFNPSVVGVTATTPLINELKRIVTEVKKFNRDIITIGGGAHISSVPEWTMKNTGLDFGVIGEGEKVLIELLSASDPKYVPGIVYRDNGLIKITECGLKINNLDEIPKPAWDIIDLSKYRVSGTLARKNPVAGLETSRGCPYGCVYCCKSVFGKTYRVKSPERVVDEVKDYIRAGFKEIHILDDAFANNRERAMEICQLIASESMDIIFCAANGLRVDNVDYQLLMTMKKAGFYRVAFGVETGDPEVLKHTGKGTDLDTIRRGFQLAKEVGLETLGYFMFGLPGETEESMQRTIAFAKELEPTIAKFNITVPLPGTSLFEKWQGELSGEWADYGYHMDGIKTPGLNEIDRDIVRTYYDRAYKSFYWRPKYIMNQLLSSIKNRTLIDYIKAAISTKW